MKKKHPILRNRMKDKKRDMDFIDLDEQDFDDEDLYDDEDYDDEEYEDDEYDDDEYDDEEYEDEEYDDEEYDEDDRYDEEEYDEEDPEDGYDDDGAYSDAEEEYDDVDEEYDEDDRYDNEEYDDDDRYDGNDRYEEDYDDYESSEYDEYDDPEDEYYDDYEEEGFDGYYEDPVGPKKSILDIVMIGSGIVAALLLIVVGVFLIKKNPGTTQSEMFENFGSSMEGIDIIGHEGLIAMADANAARIYAAREAEEMALAEIFEEENGEEEQVKEEKPAIIMNLVSVQKDLKIKFVNNSNNRLVTGVNFEVSVTDPSGTTNTQKDTDADGIIYLKNIDPGTYKVALNGPESDDYIFSKDSVSIKVKDTIEYKKVDVVDEIKSEKEVNAAVEDTAQAIETESTLKDTVEWVESAKVTLSENVTYTEVKKSDESIEKPEDAYKKMTKKSKRFEPNDPTDPEEDEPSPSPSEDPEPDPTTEPDPTDAPTSMPTDDPTPDPTDSPTSRPTDSPTPDPTREPSPSPTKEPTAAPTPTATPKATATATPKATATATAKASVTPSPSVTPTVTPTASPKTTPTATPTISPEEKAKKDTTNILKDKKGNEFYVKDGDKYRKATFADYYKYDVFYKAVKTGEYKYTGWQTIDGYTYFYDKNGKFVTGEQVIQGAKYTFDADGHLSSGSGALGIDVSKWNGTINWENVKKSGISYVIIRCGYRGSSSGALVADPQFKANINGAKDAGLKVGVYFYSQAVDEVEAVEEASMTLSLIGGYSLSYPVFIDVEGSKGRGDDISAEQRTAVCKAFCQTIQNSGYKAGVYSNKTWLSSYLDVSSLSGYKIWLAQYASEATYNKSRYDMWQYSSKGTIPGINGNVDMNISYMGY